MEIIRGQVVRSVAGRDKGAFQAVLEIDGAWALVADGKHRPLERPKRKKLLHLAPTAAVLPEEALGTNRQIRTALAPFGQQAAKT